MCDGTPCPCNIEPKPKRVATPEQQRKGAIVALNVLGPLLAGGLVTAYTGDASSGAMLMLAWWLIALVGAAVTTIRRG
jgi:hypothetical protein